MSSGGDKKKSDTERHSCPAFSSNAATLLVARCLSSLDFSPSRGSSVFGTAKRSSHTPAALRGRWQVVTVRSRPGWDHVQLRGVLGVF